MKNNFICPVCGGSGSLEKPITIDIKKEAVKCLINNGFGIRETQRLLNYKSPRSITKILEDL